MSGVWYEQRGGPPPFRLQCPGLPLALAPQESKSQAGKTCKLFLFVADTHAARHPEVVTATAGRLSDTAVPPRL